MTNRQPEQTFFLPNFCNWRTFFSISSICLLVALIVALIRWQRSPNPLLELSLIMVFLLWVALACAAALCIARIWLMTLPRVVALLITYLLVLSITVGISVICWEIAISLNARIVFSSPDRSFFVLNNLGIAAIVTTIALRYMFVMHEWKRRVETEARAQMQALLSRIRPHFLFNTLNTIAELTRTDAAAAETAIDDLAELLRITMRQTDQWISLREELDICATYVRVEQLRMGQRLEVNWQVATDILDLPVPLLCIQPLIENAVKHGAEHMRDERAIKISIRKNSDKKMRILIENPFDANAQSVSPSGQRLALGNIRERLKLSYGKEALLQTAAHGDWFVVELVLPTEKPRK